MNICWTTTPKFAQALGVALQEVNPLLSPWIKEASIQIEQAEEGFALRHNDQGTLILAAGVSEALRALALLAAALEQGKTEVYIEQQTPFATRGVMYDCSRNSVPKVETVRMLLRRIAIMGLNTLMLYTEDTYTVAEVPALGHYRGRYSQQEIREIDDYAALLGIELIPCIQTISHMERLLRWPCMEGVRDDMTTLYVDKAQTEALVRAMIQGASAPVRSKRIHLGLDEAHGLGLGQRVIAEGYEEKETLMRRHLHMIQGICDELGLRPMMWGDMLFRVNIEGHGYYDEKVQLPSRMGDVIPKGMEVIYWDYYHNDKAFYDSYLQKHIDLGFKPVFVGGVCSWLGMQPNMVKSQLSIQAGLAACRDAGVQEVFSAVWRDDGAEGLPGSVLLGIQMLADACWEQDDTRCQAQTAANARVMSGGDYGRLMEMGRFDVLEPEATGYWQPLEPANPHKYFLWQDPLLGQFDCEAAGGAYAQVYEQKALALTDAANCAPEVRDALHLAKALAAFLAFKVDLGIRMKAAYDLGDKKALGVIAADIRERGVEKLTTLYALHEDCWMRWYKPFGWEVQDIRYGGMMLRLTAAARRMEAYISGELDQVDELEQPRLTYKGEAPLGKQPLPCVNVYVATATVANL